MAGTVPGDDRRTRPEATPSRWPSTSAAPASRPRCSTPAGPWWPTGCGSPPPTRCRPTARTAWCTALAKLVSSLPEADRVSAGFPGMVRRGVVMSAPHFVTESGPGSPVDPELEAGLGPLRPGRRAWPRPLGKPTRVANDADVQGLAVVDGQGPGAGDHAGDRVRHGRVPRRPAPAAPGDRPPAVPQGRDLQRAARGADPQGDRRPPVEPPGRPRRWPSSTRSSSTTTSTSAAATPAGSTATAWGPSSERTTVGDNTAGHPGRHQALGEQAPRPLGGRAPRPPGDARRPGVPAQRPSSQAALPESAISRSASGERAAHRGPVGPAGSATPSAWGQSLPIMKVPARPCATR